jgi:hypothetical protein
MMANPPVENCLDDGKKQETIPVRVICVGSDCCQRAVKRDTGADKDHKPAEADDPADGKVSL